jgi:hypothetical protein
LGVGPSSVFVPPFFRCAAKLCLDTRHFRPSLYGQARRSILLLIFF